MKYPDYENGLVNLSNSILRNFKADCKHKSLSRLDEALDKGFQNVVLMLFDGMGMDALTHCLPDDSFLRRHYVQTISSVFPPTTTAALTSIKTGLTPYEHGWLGWSLYFKEIDKIVELFPNTVREGNGEQAADYNVAGKWLPHRSIANDIDRAGHGRMITISPFEGRRISRYDELFTNVCMACTEPGRKYVYAYWHQPDAIMHETGCHSAQTAKMIKRIDQSIETLCASLHDTLLIVTADHGHIDVHYQFISDHPELMRTLVRPSVIENRVVAFYIKEEYKRQFPREFRKAFGGDFLLLSRDDVLESGLFGNGTRNPRFMESVGDYLAVATGDGAIANSRESTVFTSHHAGLTEMEMDVPLILIEKDGKRTIINERK